MDIPTPPTLDESLCREAERLATGAHVHRISSWIGIYRNSISGAHQLIKKIQDSNPPMLDMIETLHRRVETASDYEQRLRQWTMKLRQESCR